MLFKLKNKGIYSRLLLGKSFEIDVWGVEIQEGESQTYKNKLHQDYWLILQLCIARERFQKYKCIN